MGKALYLRPRKNDAAYKKTDLIGSYRNRPPSESHLTLEQYFYDSFRKKGFFEDSDSKRKKYRILIPKGLQCRPSYPVTYQYARGMLVMHRPWSKREGEELTPILKDKNATIRIFMEMLGQRKLPLYVLAEYDRVVRNSLRYRFECIAKEGKHSDPCLDELDEDMAGDVLHMEHSRHLSSGSGMRSSTQFNELHADIGMDHDWSQPFFTGSRSRSIMDGSLYVDYLKDFFYSDQRHQNDTGPILPRNKQGQLYKLEDLNQQQQVIVLKALDTMIKFLTNDPEYIPFRATIVGPGGTGKSHIINTLITLVRQMTHCTDTVQVAAPSGGAAYNVQGCTLHRLLSLSVDKKILCNDLSDDKQTELSKRLENLLMLIIDERSMIGSSLLAAAERNLRHCAFGRQNQSQAWGGVPVVLLFGDDHQLMPVQATGVIEGYGHRLGIRLPGSTKKSGNEQILEEMGHELFISDLTQHVFNLTENYRTINDPEFGSILERLRIGTSTDDDVSTLMKRSLGHFDPSAKARVENLPNTVWLFTCNWQKDIKNTEKLVHLSNSTQTPIARLRCQWHTNRCYSNRTVIRSHFKKNTVVLRGDICVGASVALSGINIVPEVGLYNGARGNVVDIKYDSVVGPNDKHGDFLPKYVVVDFPGLRLGNAKPWDCDNPTVSGMVPSNGYPQLVPLHASNLIIYTKLSACPNSNDRNAL